MVKAESFEEKIKQFIELLEGTKIDGFYNPWAKCDKSDETRRDNLREFLLARENAKYVLIGEAPSTGARYTGIPMTSEEIIEQYPEIFKGIKTTSEKGNIHEDTAQIVWDGIIAKNPEGKNFVIWNAFAFNKDNEGNYVKNPSIKILTSEANINILKAFLDLFPKAKLIAIGRQAQHAIGYAKSEYVRHPSTGGQKPFKEYFEQNIK